MAPNISIVIPLYNCENTVERSIRSVIDQTYQDFEIIAVDNNCTDRTMEIVRREADSSGKLKVVKCATKGIVPALNAGLRAATGEWIARQDGDDYWYPEKLEKQIAFLEQNKEVQIVGTQIRLLDVDGNVEEEGTFGKKVKYPTDNDMIKSALVYGQNPLCHPSIIFNRALVDLLGGYEQFFPLAEDLHMWLRALPHFRFANVNEVLVDYTQKKDPSYDARVPLIMADMYYNLYKTVGIISGNREPRIYDWQVDPSSHGNTGIRNP